MEGEKKIPAFVQESGQKSIKVVENFVSKIAEDKKIKSDTEDETYKLMDSISETNYIYFKHGMIAGANLIIQLLGLYGPN